LTWLGLPQIDLLGPKFKIQGIESFFRAIPTENLEAFYEVESSHSVRELIRKALIEPETIEPSFSVDGFAAVLSQKPLLSGFGKDEISYERRVRIARRWLEINLELIEDGLCLVDAHTDNWGFDDAFEPRWIDMGSITKMVTGAEGLKEFRSANLRPLRMAARAPQLIEWYLEKSISREQQLALRAPRIYQLVSRNSLSRRFVLAEDLGWNLRAFLGLATNFSALIRRRKMVLRRLLSQLEALPTPAPTTGPWSLYRKKTGVQESLSDIRGRTIVEIVEELRPSTVLDVGANDGWATLACLREGMHFTVVEPDHGALSRFTSRLSDTTLPTNASVKAFVGDFRRGDEPCELVLALALTHHLSLSQQYSFGEIARTLSDKSLKWVLVEFMPLGLVSGPTDMPQPNLPRWYCIENFLAALHDNFAEVEEIDYPRRSAPHRLLFLCRKASL
jgi:hypothetical protein